jgi:probable F420-dependent oxidoreductase
MRAVSFGASLGSFGAGLVPGPTLLQWGEEIERLGFDVLWFRDHVLWHSPVLDPFTALGGLAARTSRIRLGPGVLLLPLRSPLLVAKAVASLDFISAGRAVLGVGVGGEFPKEYEACGVPVGERGRRADEGIEALRALWTTSPASYKGHFFQFEDVAMAPRPVQSPHPPIWVGGRSDAALTRAGRLGDGWLAYFVTPERFGEGLEKIGRHLEAREEAPPTFGAGLVLYISIAPTREEAARVATRYLTEEYRQPFDHLVQKYCALGPVPDCLATLRRFVEAGARHLTLIPTAPPALCMEGLRQIAAEILPAFSAERPRER